VSPFKDLTATDRRGGCTGSCFSDPGLAKWAKLGPATFLSAHLLKPSAFIRSPDLALPWACAYLGIALTCQSTESRAALGVSWYQAGYLCMLAAAYAQVGQAEPGLRTHREK
jgi:hypothetical protein